MLSNFLKSNYYSLISLPLTFPISLHSYTAESTTIVHFWSIVHSLSSGTFLFRKRLREMTHISFNTLILILILNNSIYFKSEQKKKLLFFITGTNRVPFEGVGQVSLNISRGHVSKNALPTAHTCFNQLVLPNYQNRQILEEKLLIAINNAEGFGLKWARLCTHFGWMWSDRVNGMWKVCVDPSLW